MGKRRRVAAQIIDGWLTPTAINAVRQGGKMTDPFQRIGPRGSQRLREVGVLLMGLTSQVVLCACGSLDFDTPVTQRPTGSSVIVDDPDDPIVPDDIIDPADVTTGTEKTLWFEATPVFCCNPLSLDFVVDETQLPDGVSGPYEWDFDDGRTAIGAVVEHTFTSPGDYLVTVTAAASAGPDVEVERLISFSGDVGDGINDTLDPPDGDVVDGAGDDGDGQVGEPTAPVADAGSDQSVEPGDVVQLDGSGSFSQPAAALAYLWSQSSGPEVVLSDVGAEAPTFTAPPADDGPVTLTFELLVGASGLSDSDTVTISVVPTRVEPEWSFPPGVRVGFISGPGGVSAPGPAEVSWTFVGNVSVSNVHLTQDCCRCADVDSGYLAPDGDGVYHSSVSVPTDGEIWYYVQYRLGGVDYRSHSVHVNPPAGDPGADPAPVIWYQHYGRDPEILYEVARSGVVTHVVLAGADRVVYAIDHPSITRDIQICRETGLEIIWSRHLWNNWENFQTLQDTFDSEFYASVVAQVNSEAAALGIELTALDCEVYGQAPLDEYFDDDLPTENFEAMQAAILQAATLGQVDFVYPSGTTWRPLHHNNLYRDLGRRHVSQGTYYDAPEKICTIDYEYHVLAAYVQPTTERPAKSFFPYFLPYDVVERRQLWSQADGAGGVVNGLWLYPGATADTESTVWEVATMLADYFAGP